MKIEKGKTSSDKQMIEFSDVFNGLCRMWVLKGTKQLRFDLDPDFAQFSQEDIKMLLPYLQLYAETGQLEPQESPLQGDSLAEAFKPENLIRVSAEQNVKLYEQERKIEELEKGRSYYLRQCDQYVDQVAELEEVIEKWRNAVERGIEASSLNELQKETAKLLGEE